MALEEEASNKKAREVAFVTIAAAVLVALFSYLPIERGLSGTLVSFAFIALPFAAASFFKLELAELGLTLSAWKKDLKLFALFSATLFPAYTLLYIPWQGWVLLHRSGGGKSPFELLTKLPDAASHIIANWEWKLMDGWYLFILAEFIAIALPEELFFRGYLQGRLDAVFTKRITIFGAQLGMAIVVSAAVFALMHLISIPNPLRLGVFFPALLFGFMRAKTGTILSAALFHTAANAYTSFMDYCAFGS